MLALTEAERLALISLVASLGVALIAGVFGVVSVRAQRRIERNTNELRPNGGSSLADRVDSIATELADARSAFLVHDARLRSVERLTMDNGAAIGSLHQNLAAVAGDVEHTKRVAEATAASMEGHVQWHAARDAAAVPAGLVVRTDTPGSAPG